MQLLQDRCSTEKNNLCCNNGAAKFLGAGIHALLPLQCWKHAGYRGLKCCHVHILEGEAGKVCLHRFKTATALLANNREEMTRR